MKFRVTVTYEYEVSDGDALEHYDTTAPDEMAAIDQGNYYNSPMTLVQDVIDHNADIRVEPVQ